MEQGLYIFCWEKIIQNKTLSTKEPSHYIDTERFSIEIDSAIENETVFNKGTVGQENNLTGQYVIGAELNDTITSDVTNAILYGGAGDDKITSKGYDKRDVFHESLIRFYIKKERYKNQTECDKEMNEFFKLWVGIRNTSN